MSDHRINLPESRIPTAWYNITADFKTPPAPYLHPVTKEPLKPDDLAAIFPQSLIEQEVSTKRYIDIPGEVIDLLRQYRPSPLHRAKRLEKALGTPAKIYFKYEGVSPAGSHKPNTAIPQAWYNKKAGIKRLTTETGAGQWGQALSLACQWLGLECTVYMVRVSYKQKAFRPAMMRMWNADVIPSPSDKTEAGRAVLAQDPNSLGSLGIAISEAVEDAAKRADTNYALGSVLNHVLLHQTVIGLEAKEQLAIVDDYPDIVIGCCGGGSNFAGITFPFLGDKLRGESKKNTRFIGVEPAACPTLTRGRFCYDYGDIAKFTPLTKMYTLGHTFMPAGIHAGGLRYHGMSTLISHAVHDGYIEPRAYQQIPCFQGAHLFASTEGIVPAPESSHAIRAAIDEALVAKEKNEEKTILFCLSGHGFLDMSSYSLFMKNELADNTLPEDELARALADLPTV